MMSISHGQAGYLNPQDIMLTDEAAALQAQAGDFRIEEYLLKKYTEMVQFIANPYFLQGAEKEDILQEGTIGLFEAIHSFSPDKDCSFRSFARVCISRQIITAVKSYSRQKHIPLNISVSFQNVQNTPEESEQYYDPKDFLTPAMDEYLISKENIQGIHTYIDATLSPFEKKVFRYFVEGKSYQTISEELNKPLKSVDGTLQRVRKKLKAYFNNED